MALSTSVRPRWSPRTIPPADRRFVAILVALPVVVFCIPALLGHPAVVGDNLLQNYPLRVLTGEEIRAGHWPLWNPFADSGTPLLGGMNAGSFFPATMLFVVLPGLVAWIAGVIFVYWGAALGVYVLARWLSVCPSAAFVAALTYAYTGAMIGQLVHIGVVQGQAILPWLVLGQLVLARDLLGTSRADGVRVLLLRAAPGTVGIAACIGLIGLTGEPRSIADAEMVAGIVLVIELIVHGGVRVATAFGRVAFLACTAIGAIWGIALAAAQLLPGEAFIDLSERSKITYAFFSSGSLPARWVTLLFSQGLLGDNGSLSPRFFAAYNLPEVTGYVGLCVLIALAAFAAQCAARRAPAARRRFVVFAVIAVAGVVLAVGSETALGPVLHAIPLFGQTRLQSRNLALFDFGGALTLAWWLDAVVRGRLDEASLIGRRRVVTAAPLVFTVLGCLLTLCDPRFVVQSLVGVTVSEHVASGIRVTVAVSLSLALGYLALVARGTRDVRRLARALMVVCVLDIVCFNIFYVSGFISGLSSVEPSRAYAVSVMGDEGRIALVDPGVTAYHQTAPLGLGNLDVFTGIPSVQGYGSLISARYSAATGARLLSTMSGCDLAKGTFAQLRLASIAVAENGFVVPHFAAGDTCGALRPTSSVRRFFGQQVAVDELTFAGLDGAPISASTPAVELFDGSGARVAAPVVVRHVGAVLVASYPTHPVAAGVELVDARGISLASTTLSPSSGPTEVLDAKMQVGLNSPDYRLVAVRGRMTYFKAVHVRPMVWLDPAPRGATATVVATSISGAMTVQVRSSRAVVLVRSESWLPGWVAQLRSPSGATRAVTVRPDGLIQSVRVPAGTWDVEFDYAAPRLVDGLAATGLAIAALAVALCWLWLGRRRARRVHGSLPDR